MLRFLQKPFAYAAVFSVMLASVNTFVLLKTYVIPSVQGYVTELSDNSSGTTGTTQVIKGDPVISDSSYADENIQITLTTMRYADTDVYVADITLSSAEDTQILTQYINASAQDVESVLKQFITSSTYGSTITMSITNTRGDADFDTRVQDMIQSYVTLNSVGEYLAMNHPDLAQKYQSDARQRMEALMIYVIYKKPPTSPSYSYADVLGTIENS